MEVNKVYCMDNLKLLKQLPNESINLIYCDILYNTGKKFKDYDDKLGTPQEAIRIDKITQDLLESNEINYYTVNNNDLADIIEVIKLHIK